MKPGKGLPLFSAAFSILLLSAVSNASTGSSPGESVRNRTTASVAKFKGLCYSPYRDNESPDNNVHPSVEEITQDLSFVGGLTSAIRTYGTTDNMEQIPLLCEQYGIDCYPGAWISKNECENKRQIDSLIKIANLGLSHVKGLNVGCETLLRNDVTEAQLIEYISRVKEHTHLPVSTSEVWSTWLEHPNLANAVDTIFVHIYSYWDYVSIDSASAYLLGRWNAVSNAYPNKTIIVGETGWPSSGLNRGAAIPGATNQQKYLSDFLAVTSQNNIDYFFFEVFDEKWKVEETYEIGEHWGIFNADGSPKPALTELLPEQARAGFARAAGSIVAKNVKPPLYVYRDGCDAENGFSPSGWMGELATLLQTDSTYKDAKQILDESCGEDPHSGSSCLKISYKPSPGAWGGIYWQFPINNWGKYPGYCFGDTKASFTFWARGQKGGEKGEFKTGGIYDSQLSYHDSYGPKSTGVIQLDTAWRQFDIDLAQADLRLVIGGFCWVTNYDQNPSGCTIFLDDIIFDVVSSVGTTGSAIPADFGLSQNYPNPFNPTTIVSYQLPAASSVRLAVYDEMGREVTVLVDRRQAAGRYEVEWNAAGLSSGVYICRMNAGDHSASMMMTLVK
jgi:exo-beta-1,3-glucanase (GH17 family)